MSSTTRNQITVVTILLASLSGTSLLGDEVAGDGGNQTAICDPAQHDLGCTTTSCQQSGAACLQPWATAQAGTPACAGPRLEPSCGCNGPVQFSISDGGCGCGGCGGQPACGGCAPQCGCPTQGGCCGGGCGGGCGNGCNCALFSAIFGSGCPTCGCDPCPDSVGGLRVRSDGPGAFGCHKAKCGGNACCGDPCGNPGMNLAKFSLFRKKGCGDGCGKCCHGSCGQCGEPCVGLLGRLCGCCGKSTCGAAGGGAYHCGMPAPQYPCPYYTPRPTAPTYISYAPLAPHNSLPQYRSTYSFKHGCGLSRTTVHWRPTTVCNAFDYLHHMIEIPR